MSMPTKVDMPPPGPGETYRPVSILAIAGLGLGLVSGIVFLLDEPWLLFFLPLPGLMISLIAYLRISRSEATLAGGPVATVALILNLITGLGWMTMYLTTWWVVQGEAKTFLNSWFERLRAGKEGEAFLYSVEPGRRRIPFAPDQIARLRIHYASSYGGNQYDGFRGSFIPALALRYTDQVHWKFDRGVEQKYDHARGTYQIGLVYHVTSPEISGDVLFLLKSEPGRGRNEPRRRWKYESGQFLEDTVKYTDYGQELLKARAGSSEAMKNWVMAMGKGRLDESMATVLSVSGHRQLVAGCVAGFAMPVSAVPAIPALATATRATVAPVADKVGAFSVLYRSLSNDAVPRSEPLKFTYVLLKDEREGDRWTLAYRSLTDGRAYTHEFELTAIGEPTPKGTVWRPAHFKLLGTAKKPPSPTGM